MSAEWDKKDFSEPSSESEADDNLSDEDFEGPPLVQAAPRDPSGQTAMTGLIEDENEPASMRYQGHQIGGHASAFPLPGTAPSHTGPKPTRVPQLRYQQARVERPVTPPDERLISRPGEQFSYLTDTARIEIEGGDGKPGFIETLERPDEQNPDDKRYRFHKALVDNLKQLHVSEPTAVQKATWYAMLNKYAYNLVVQAQTGSGKTFAFLVPVIQRVFELKEFLKKNKQSKPRNAPLAIILVPTRELVKQIMDYAKHLVKDMNILVTSSQLLNEVLRDGTDIHVTTLGSMKDAMTPSNGRKYAKIQLSHVYLTVFDEVEKFFNDFQSKTETTEIIDEIQKYDNARIFAFSATMRPDILQFVEKQGYFQIIDSEPVPPSIEHHTFVLEPQQAQAAIISLLRHLKAQNNNELPKILIFTNRRVICDVLCLHLNTYGFPAMSLSSKWTRAIRARVASSFEDGDTKILVCSDLLAPGVDWVVDVVINYHLPPVEEFDRFAHRIGRTGRAGNKGVVYSFFYNGVRDQISPDDFAENLKNHDFPVPRKLQEFYDYYRRNDEERDLEQLSLGFDDPELSDSS
uniref:ATP-dependent RNA helicase n=1 Tax=Steinernema glaseri TaxID=37863 RepID=A0A1I8AGC7_9BILA